MRQKNHSTPVTKTPSLQEGIISPNTIENYRRQIDVVDDKIVQLLAERANCAVEIGKIKHGHSQAVYNPKREKDILDRVTSINKEISSPLSSSSVKYVFMEVISSCRSLEYIPKIAYLGPDGSFSHLAALKQFGSSVEFLPQPNINAAIHILSRGHCDYAVLPIENSIEGMVNNTIDQLSIQKLYINAELFLPIRLCFFVAENQNKGKRSSLSQSDKEKIFSKIKTLYSHPQPFGQARNWIEKHLPRVDLQETHSTSHAAELCLKSNERSRTRNQISACIGSEQLLKVFPKLRLVEDKIEDEHKNTTRFVVIAPKHRVPEQGDIITSLLITIKDKSGALYEILAAFAKSKINLTNLVSRPSKRKAFDYLFYIDFEGSVNEPRVEKVLKRIKPYVVEVKIIGSYPRGTFF